jgi:hypothetical protein
VNVIDFFRVINECKNICGRDVRLDIWLRCDCVCVRLSWIDDAKCSFDYNEPDNSIEMTLEYKYPCGDISNRVVNQFKSEYLEMWGERD